MHISQKHNIEWNKPKTKEPSLYDSIHIILMKEVKLINGGGSQNRGYMRMRNHFEELAGDVLWQLPAHFHFGKIHWIVWQWLVHFSSCISYLNIKRKSVWIFLLLLLFIFELLTTWGLIKLRNFLLGNYCVFRKIPNYTFIWYTRMISESLG